MTTAGDGGAFAFTDVVVGSYTLFFSDPQGRYFDEYWRDSVDFAGATFVEVTGGGTATVAAELSLTKGSVAGTVAGVGGGSGEGFNVSLYDASSNYRGVTTAGAGGAFVFTDVAVGSYTLFFSDPQGRYFDEYWRDSVDFAGRPSSR